MPARFDGPMYAHPLFDRTRIADHAAYLPAGQVALLLGAFARELEEKPALIAQLTAAGDVAGLRAAAHHFKGAAMSVGGARVAWIADAIERSTPEAMPVLVEALAKGARDTLAEVLAVADELEAAAG